MKVKVIPTQDIDRLKQNLVKRTTEVEKKDDKLSVELENPEKLAKIPGIEEYSYKGESFEGIKGEPVNEEVYAKLETREDAVRCLKKRIQK